MEESRERPPFPFRAPSAPLGRAAPPRWGRIAIRAGALLALAGCTDGDAPSTIPSAEPPEAERIDVSLIADDRRIQGRVLNMSFAEMSARLGPLAWQGTTRIRARPEDRGPWTKSQAEAKYRGPRRFSVVARGPDGVDALALTYLHPSVYIQNGPGAPRESAPWIESPHRVLEDQTSGLRALHRRFAGRLVWRPLGEATVEGWPVVRFAVRLTSNPSAIAGVVPQSIEGEISIHRTAGVPVSAQLQSRFEEQGPGKANDRIPVALTVSWALRPLGDGRIEAPAAPATVARADHQLSPLSFLKGRVRTSTVIGGKRPASGAKGGKSRDP